MYMLVYKPHNIGNVRSSDSRISKFSHKPLIPTSSKGSFLFYSSLISSIRLIATLQPNIPVFFKSRKLFERWLYFLYILKTSVSKKYLSMPSLCWRCDSDKPSILKYHQHHHKWLQYSKHLLWSGSLSHPYYKMCVIISTPFFCR